MDNLTVFVVPHTHWDREWYLPFEIFRKKLTDTMSFLIGKLEGEPEFRTFVLDGQTVILQDYLECHPEHRSRITSLVQEGRLAIGPWYTLPDEFLVSGESLIRNLLIGHITASESGKVMKVGYLPDSFGHISQLPQILKGFNIDCFVFTRGIGNEPKSTEYAWTGSDGSTVRATLQVFAYNNAGYLPGDLGEAVRRVIQEVERLAPYLASGSVLLNNGGDHAWPSVNLPEIVREISSRGIFKEIRIGHFGDYCASLDRLDQRSLPTLHGELRGSHSYPVLAGVISSRMKLKMINHAMMNLVEKWSEPFTTIAMSCGMEYPQCIMLHLWKILLQNHAHDSICGSSVDEVHEENLLRFKKVKHLGRLLKQEALSHIAGKINTDKAIGAIPIIVFNPLNVERTEPVVFKMATEKSNSHYEIRDYEGNRSNLQVLDRRTFEGSYPYPSRAEMLERELVFLAKNVPPLGYRTFYILPCEEKAAAEPQQGHQEAVIENEYYRLGWDSIEHLYLVHKKSGKKFPRLNEFIDDADCGDEYNFSPLVGDRTLVDPIAGQQFSVSAQGPVQKTLQIRGNLALPSGLTKDRRARSPEIEMCPYVMRISLFEEINRVDFTCSIDNRSKDHRLRVSFPFESDNPRVYVETPFDLLKREMELPTGADWIEKPSPTQPQGRLLLLRNDSYNVALFNRGITEVEVEKQPQRCRIILTLLRCVGWLSRPDIVGRAVEAGPKIPTPDAQNLDTFSFSYSIMITEASRDIALFPQYAQCFDIPMEGLLTDEHQGELPHERSFLGIHPAMICTSAVKKAEAGENIVVRFYNPSDARLSCNVLTTLPVSGFYELNLAEERIGDFIPLGAPCEIGPKKIKTVELVRE